jgi:hypothetical protein
MSRQGYIILIEVILLAIVSISIAWHLFTSDYPTHSDVFFMGVEAGALAIVLSVCLFLICLLIYRLVMLAS